MKPWPFRSSEGGQAVITYRSTSALPKMRAALRHALRVATAAVLVTAVVLAPVSATADQRSDALIRLLETSTEFRVRTQAALSLGRTSGGTQVVQALVRALSDSNAAVRAAAANSLGAVGDPSAVAALQRLSSDSDRAVRTAATSAVRTIQSRGGSSPSVVTPPPTTVAPPSGTSRYYVGVGMPGSRATRLGPDMLQHARSVLVQQVRAVDGVELAPENESNTAATSVIQRRRLAGVYIDCSIVSADATANGTRVAVSVIVGTYPGRDMRAILNGAATVPGAGGVEADRAAVEGAIRGALRNLPQALTSAAGTPR